MLTDTKLKNLKGAEKLYKVTDRDGLYVAVSPAGLISFRLDYRLNGRRETLTIGRYGPSGISLADARDACTLAKKMVAEGKSPTQEKKRAKTQAKGEKTFGHFAQDWLDNSPMAATTKLMRASIVNAELMPAFKSRLLSEVTPDDLRTLCEQIRDRGAPSTAIHARAITGQIFDYAVGRGHRAPNPAAEVRASAIATQTPKERALSPREVQVFFDFLPRTGTAPSMRLALELILLTLVRKGELLGATWEEVDFDQALWSIPAERMKGRRPHNVYLSRQAVKLFETLKMCAGNSRYVIPNFFGRDKPASKSSLNSAIDAAVEKAKEGGGKLGDFAPHDLRRTASTLLNEAGFNYDWIEKCLAHHKGGIRAVYNKAQYAAQRAHMMQEWAAMVEAMKVGGRYNPVLMPPHEAIAMRTEPA